MGRGAARCRARACATAGALTAKATRAWCRWTELNEQAAKSTSKPALQLQH